MEVASGAVPVPRLAAAADWALSQGIASLTTGQIAELWKIPRDHVPSRMRAPKGRGEWISPARGLWVPVLPEFRARSGVPAIEFIDPMMRFLGIEKYYVGWLMAASLYGAAHHAPQVTQVAVPRVIRDKTVGDSRIEFYARSAIGTLPVVERQGRWGRFYISTPEVTALDIAANIRLAGGLSNAATVMVDLVEVVGLDEGEICAVLPHFPVAAVQRLGWVLETFTSVRLDELARYVNPMLPTNPTLLHPALAGRGQTDKRWRILVNGQVDLE